MNGADYMNNNTEEITVRSGNIEISCDFHKPESIKSFPVVIAIHASGLPLKSDFIYKNLADLLVPSGVGVCCFDRRGSGESNGDFEVADFHDLAGDVVSIIDDLSSRNEVAKIGLWGISQGGWIAPLAATLSNRCEFMVLVSSTPFTVSEQMNYSTRFAMYENGYGEKDIEKAIQLRELVREYFLGSVEYEEVKIQIEECKSEQWFEVSGVPPAEFIPLEPKATKMYQEIKFNPEETIKSVAVPTLLLYGETDPWIPVEQSIDYWQRESKAASKDLLTISRIQNANHFMTKISEVGVMGSDGTMEEEYSQVLVKWLKAQF